jgi:hypothetical protein
MKPYWIGFFIVFLNTYIANAETSTEPSTETSTKTTCIWSEDNTNCIITPGDDCNQITSTTTIDADTYLYCSSTDKTWYLCDSKCGTVSGNTTPCKKGFIFRNNKCLSCADLIDEDHATTEKEGTATSMSSCILPSDKENGEGGKEKIQYTDEKGTYTYASSCFVQCTEETAHLCTNTSA